ncbi:hypothetical protein Tco_0298783 [Tanacetum coccineum]
MENSKRRTIPMQDKLKLSKSEVAIELAKSAMSKYPYLRLWFDHGDMKRELRVSCYTDAGYLTDADDLRSQTGYVFFVE